MAAHDIAQSIIKTSQPRCMRYATIRARGMNDDEPHPFHVHGIAEGGEPFDEVEDAINHIHRCGYIRLGERDESYFITAANRGLDNADGVSLPDLVVGVFSKDAAAATSAQPNEGNQAEATLNVDNLVSTLVEAAVKSASQPQIITLRRCPRPPDPDYQHFIIVGDPANDHEPYERIHGGCD